MKPMEDLFPFVTKVQQEKGVWEGGGRGRRGRGRGKERVGGTRRRKRAGEEGERRTEGHLFSISPRTPIV
jgi:hypothetical protein